MNHCGRQSYRGRYPPVINKDRSKSQSYQPTDILFARSGKPVQLLRKIGQGGEGSIHETDWPNLVAKVYHKGMNDRRQLEKIQQLIDLRIGDPSFCLPTEILHDHGQVFRGFLMPRMPATAISLQGSIFQPTKLLATYPNWTRRESTELAITILKKIQLLHSRGILIGDISPTNILMSDSRTIHFIDCDSYQIDRFPCPVATPLFTPPELQGMSLRQTFRTVEHELFAIAVLLFMIFMPGKGPYSHKGGDQAIANIRKGHFPYSLGERHSDGAPIGPWRLCWSHLSRNIKTAFHRSFHRDHISKPRVSIDRWLTILRKYAWFLSRDENVFHGPAHNTGVDLSIMPANFRRVRTEDGRIEPPWRTDSLTDRQARTRNLKLFSNFGGNK